MTHPHEINQELIPGPHVTLNAKREPVLIRSGEHHAWWRPGRSGYCSDVTYAGRYSLREAIKVTHHCGPEKMISIEDDQSPVPDARTGQGGIMTHDDHDRNARRGRLARIAADALIDEGVERAKPRNSYPQNAARVGELEAVALAARNMIAEMEGCQVEMRVYAAGRKLLAALDALKSETPALREAL